MIASPITTIFENLNSSAIQLWSILSLTLCIAIFAVATLSILIHSDSPTCQLKS